MSGSEVGGWVGGWVYTYRRAAYYLFDGVERFDVSECSTCSCAPSTCVEKWWCRGLVMRYSGRGGLGRAGRWWPPACTNAEK
jgi:hypothetical protein